MQSILRSQICQSINFEIGAVTIDGPMLGKVADALYKIVPSPPVVDKDSTRLFRKVTSSFWVQNTRAKLEIIGGKLFATMGEYEPANNAFILPFSDTAGDTEREATVVHESVHAALDMAGQPHLELDNEAAARIAAEWYRLGKLKSGYTLSTNPLGETMSQTGPFALIAQSAQKATTKPYVVPDNQRQFVHAVLNSHGYPSRRDKLDDSDGVLGPISKELWEPITPTRTAPRR